METAVTVVFAIRIAMIEIRTICLAVLGLIQFAAGTANAAVQQAFLIQNSGWMEPFYVDRTSQYKPLINAVIDAVAGTDEDVTISAFNQSTEGNESPLIAYKGKRGPRLAATIEKMGLARKGNNKALADTDFREAVVKTVMGPFASKSGIIWIFTNNKNSPNNSVETAARNREFYELLHFDNSIVRTLAFPLSMPVKGKFYKANGLMVYALAYGGEADQQLQDLIRSQTLKKILIDTPARLKPLDRDAVRLVPREVINSPNTQASLAADGRTLILDVDVSSHQPLVEIVASFENQFFPYSIEEAMVSARIAGKDWGGDLTVNPSTISNLLPNKQAEVRVSLPIPAEMPSVWSPSTLLDMGRRFAIPAAIEITLSGQRLGIDTGFRDRLASIFPGDPLPEVFVPPDAIKASTATIPMVIRVNYPLYPLLTVMFAALLAIGGILALLALAKSERRYQVVSDGQSRKLAIKAFSTVKVLSPNGAVAGVVRRGLGRPTVESVAEGHTLLIEK